jgi:hypothetical protein
VKKLPPVGNSTPLEIPAQREDVDSQSGTTTDPYSLSPVSTVDVLVGHPAKQEDEKHGDRARQGHLQAGGGNAPMEIKPTYTLAFSDISKLPYSLFP